jgi:hypothetical protein
MYAIIDVAMFDYSFVKEEFKRLGYDFRRKIIEL